MTQKTAAKKPKKELTAKDISLGDAVKVLSMNLKGTVSSRPDNKGFPLRADGYHPFQGSYF